MKSRQVMPCIDSRWIAQTFAWRREVTRPQRLSESWMLPGQSYGSVLRDKQGQWRMWYCGDPMYCENYATSRDGLHWERPDLNLELKGLDGQALDSNAFLYGPQKDKQGKWLVYSMGPEGFCVLDNEETPHPKAKARFTALYLANLESDDGGIHNGYFIVYSDDGIHWQNDSDMPVVKGWMDTNTSFFYDARIERYVIYGRPASFVDRVSHANRAIARFESEDLIHWSPCRTVLDVDDRDADPMKLLDETMLRSGSGKVLSDAERAAIWALVTEGAYAETGAMIRGRNRQWYGMTVFPWGDLYVGIGMMYDLPSGHMWLELLHSYDGIDWRREAIRKPWLEMDEEAWDFPMQKPFASPPVVVGDELWFYYGAHASTHHGKKLASAEGRPEVCIGGRKLIRDRWVGYVAEQCKAEILTQVLEGANDLSINADVKSDGELRIEVCDELGETLPGYGLEECVPITASDGTELAVAWKNQKLSDCGQPRIRLRIVAQNATLYALSFGK